MSTAADDENGRAERLLREVESSPLWAAVLDNDSQFIVICGPDGRVLRTNDVGRFGLDSIPDPAGVFVWDLPRKLAGIDVPQERIDAMKSRFDRLRRNDAAGVERTIDIDYEAGDFAYSIRMRMRPVYAHGRLAAVVIMADDIRAERAATKALREREAVLAQLIESLPHMFWSARIGSGADYFAPRWFTFSGRAPDQLVGLKWMELVHPDDRPDLERAIATVGEADAAPPLLYRLRRADGEYRWVETQFRPVRDDGEVVRVIGTTLDVTARHRDQERRREDHEFVRALMALSQMGSYSWSMRDDRFEADDRFLEITGVDPALRTSPEALDDFLERVHPDDRKLVRGRMALARTDRDGRFEQEYRLLLARSGREPLVRWVASRGRVEFDEHGPVRMVGVVSDITGRKADEEDRIRAQKAQALGTLVAGIAHDVGNVAGAVLTYARLAQQEVAAGQAPAESLEEIARGALHAAEIVQRLMAFGKGEAGVHEPVDLATVVNDAVALVRPSIRDGQTLRVEVAEGLPAVLGDATQLSQVIVNLLTNAWQAAPREHGVIVLSADTVESAKIGDAPPQRAVRIRVDDDGPGLSRHVLDNLWVSFFSTKPVDEGTGLGLPVVKHIVDRHGGSVTGTNRPGRGARFEVLLPVTATDAAQGAEPPGAPAHHGHVLFVDDGEALVRAATRAMPYRGFTVSAHTDPLAALAELEGDPGRVDVLITDLSMPGLTGLQLIERARALKPDLIAIMTSGFVGPGDDAEHLVDAIVPKPCSIDDLAAVAVRLLAERGG